MSTFEGGWDAVARVVHIRLVVLGDGTAHRLGNNVQHASLHAQGSLFLIPLLVSRLRII